MIASPVVSRRVSGNRAVASTPPRRRSAVALGGSGRWLLFALVAWGWLPFAGHAFVITNLTRGLPLFEDDFERGTAGFAPGANDPEPGTWSYNGDTILSIADLRTDNLLPVDGTNCLKIARGGRPRLTAVADPAGIRDSRAGDLLRLEFSVQVPAGVASVYPRAAEHDIAQISFFADGRVSLVDKAGQAHQFLKQTLLPQAWNRVRLDFVNGTNVWSVSVNEAAPETRPSGSSDDLHSGGLLTGARLQTDQGGTLAFFDRAPPPLPPPPAWRYEVAGRSVSFRWDDPLFRLETSFVLGEPDAWFPVPGGTRSPVTIEMEAGAQFFRLSNSTAPPVVSRELGRQTQLLVDETLVASQQNVRFHVTSIEKAGVPLISPDEPWEGTAVQISGVVKDPREGGFKMWYVTHAEAGSGKVPGARTCYAESADGVQWTKPRLGLVDFQGSKQNGLVQDSRTGAAAPAFDCVVWDPRSGEEARRFKALVMTTRGCELWLSEDGQRWAPYDHNPVCDTTGDVAPTLFDEREGQFVTFMQTSATVAGRGRRVVGRRTSADMIHWTPNQAVLTPDASEDERARVMMATRKGWMEYDGMMGFPYAGVHLGLLWPFFCNPEPAGTTEGVIHVELAWSQDGWTWQHAADRSPVIPRGTPGSFDGGMTFTAVRPIVLEDEIWIYYNGWEATHASHWYGEPQTDEPLKRGFISLGKLRRDRWVAAEAVREEGRLTTVPLRFQGRCLWVNAEASAGRVGVAILDDHYRPLPGFGVADCDPVRNTDASAQRLSWRGEADLSALAGRPIRLRFWLQNARLFAFGFGD